MHLYRFAQMLGGEKLHCWSPEGCNLTKMEIFYTTNDIHKYVGDWCFSVSKGSLPISSVPSLSGKSNEVTS